MKLLRRSPAGVARKLGNFGSLDPQLKRKNISGLGHTSEVDREVWAEFHSDWNRLVVVAAELREKLGGSFNDEEDDTLVTPSGASERLALRKQRLHQGFFRAAVLSSYASTCCVTGICLPECLVACHIVPWSEDARFQTDPTNGVCLSATFERLFDRGLMTFSEDLTILMARDLRSNKNRSVRELILSFDGKPIAQPQRFMPSSERLEWHRTNVFRS